MPPRTLPFHKMHGAGNDFIMIDTRDLGPIQLTRRTIADLCDRRTGLGADGLILLAPATDPAHHFRMIYFNADGGEAEMCGNGARCTVALAHRLDLAPAVCRFETQPGVLNGQVFGPGDVEVSLPAWKDLETDLQLEDQPFSALHTCNTGVPHVVIPVADIEAVDLEKWGPVIRRADRFAPAGTNVNWIAADTESGEFRLRTYERGVEAETLACGTGASAAAVVLCQMNKAVSPVAVRTRGGDLLTITVDLPAKRLGLRGPAVISFRGEVRIHE